MSVFSMLQAQINVENLKLIIEATLFGCIKFVIDYKEIFIVGAMLFVAIIISILIYYPIRNRRLRKKEQVMKEPVKVLPTVEKILGFDPYREMVIVERSGNFYAVASYIASMETAVEFKYKQLDATEKKIKELYLERKDLSERIHYSSEVIQALKKELEKEKNKGRKKLKSRIEDIESEIRTNEREIKRFESDMEFCTQKMTLCEKAKTHIRETVVTIEERVKTRKEILGTIENKNGATYEDVKQYEKGVRIIEQYPAIQGLISAYVDSQLQIDEAKNIVNESRITVENLKNDVKELYEKLNYDSSLSSQISKTIKIKHQEIDENVAVIAYNEQKIKNATTRLSEAQKSLTAMAATYNLSGEDLSLVEASMMALKRYQSMAGQIDADVAKYNAKLDALNKEYDQVGIDFAKCKKRNVHQKEELGNKLSDISKSISEIKAEIFKLENFRREYPNMTPAAFYKAGQGSVRHEKFTQDQYRAEIEKIKREYVETVRNSLSFGGMEGALAKQKELLARLEQIEKRIYAEKTTLRTKAITQQYRNEYGVINQRKVRIASELEKYRAELKNINSVYSANEYISKLKRFASTLSQEDLADRKIADTLRRCFEDAKMLGEQAQALWNNGGF